MTWTDHAHRLEPVRPKSSSAAYDFESLQLRVARLADEISLRDPFGKPGLNLQCWLQAERELLGAEVFEPVKMDKAEPHKGVA